MGSGLSGALPDDGNDRCVCLNPLRLRWRPTVKHCFVHLAVFVCEVAVSVQRVGRCSVSDSTHQDTLISSEQTFFFLCVTTLQDVIGLNAGAGAAEYDARTSPKSVER